MCRPLVTSREESVYKLSELLKNPESLLWKKLNAVNEFTLSEKYNDELKKLEEKMNIPACAGSIKKFKEFQNAKKEYTDINQIAEKVGQLLNRSNFSFNGIVSSNREILSKKIVDFYNFMAYFLEENDLLALLFSVCRVGVLKSFFDSSFKDHAAETIFGNNSTCTIFSRKWFSYGDTIYKTGFWPVSDNFCVFVHEYWHAILNYVTTMNFNSAKWRVYNGKGSNVKLSNDCFDLRQIVKNSKVESLKKWMLFDDYYNFMYTQNVDRKERDSTSGKLVNMVAVPSQYARQELGEELMCEAFSYWYLTPENERNYYWELIHDYFSINFFSKFYNTIIGKFVVNEYDKN